MLLSEAIRKGAEMHPQCFGTNIQGNARCALFMALEAVGGSDLGVEWPWIANEPYPEASCPKCHDYRNNIWTMMLHLNDRHIMRATDIADWVAEQEKRLGVVEPTGAKGGDCTDTEPVYRVFTDPRARSRQGAWMTGREGEV